MNFDDIALTPLTPRTSDSESQELAWYSEAKDKVFEKVRSLGFNVKLESPLKAGIPRVDVHVFDKQTAYMLELQYLAQDRVRYDLRNRKHAVSGGVSKPVCQWIYHAGTSPLNLSRESRMKDLVFNENMDALGLIVHRSESEKSRIVLSWNSKAFDEINIGLSDFGKNAIFFPMEEWTLGAEGFVPIHGTKAYEVLTFLDDCNKKTLDYEQHRIELAEREETAKMLRSKPNPFQRLEELKKSSSSDVEQNDHPYEYGEVSMPESSYNYTTDDPEVRKFVRAYKTRDIKPISRLVEFLIHQQYDSELDRDISILIGYFEGKYRDAQVLHILGKEAVAHLPFFLDYGSIWGIIDGNPNHLQLRGEFAERYKV